MIDWQVTGVVFFVLGWLWGIYRLSANTRKHRSRLRAEHHNRHGSFDDWDQKCDHCWKRMKNVNDWFGTKYDELMAMKALRVGKTLNLTATEFADYSNMMFGGVLQTDFSEEE